MSSDCWLDFDDHAQLLPPETPGDCNRRVEILPNRPTAGGAAGRSTDRVNHPHLLLERVVHTDGHQSPEVQNGQLCRAGLDTLPSPRRPCTRNRAQQRPDSPEPCSTPATTCSDTRFPDCAKARSCCPCLDTQGLAGWRRSVGLDGSAVRLTQRLPMPRSRRCKYQPACRDARLSYRSR